jgi:hypothetical protein
MDNQRIAGILLILGAVIFFGLGFGIAIIRPSVTQAGSGILTERLKGIASHPFAWPWIPRSFMVATIVNVIGVVLLTTVLHNNRDDLFAIPSLMIFSIGVVLFLAYLGFQLSVTIWASKEFAKTSIIPPSYQALEQWGIILYSIYMVLAYLAIAGFGFSFIQTGLLPNWLGWTSIVFGIVWCLNFITKFPNMGAGNFTFSDLPLWIQVWGLLVGIFLLLKK